LLHNGFRETLVTSNFELARPAIAGLPTDLPQSPSSTLEILIEQPHLAGWNDYLQGSNSMATGTVKWFNATKGFGFIAPDAGGGDVFVHISAVERSSLGSIHEGQKLNYELERDQRSGKTSAGQLTSAD